MNQLPHRPSPLTFSLLHIMSDAEFHSGESMARSLGVSRSSVNNALQGLEDYGLDLYRIRGRGYRLLNPPQLLDTAQIRHFLGKYRNAFHIDVRDVVSSSNTLLMQQAAQGAPDGTVLAAELQSSGRGRFGRAWLSGLGNALTFSLLWRFERGLSELSGLSLAVGIALLRGLNSIGINGLQLKWPNDIVDGHGTKAGGILIEAQGEMLGTATTVIGIGLNLFLPRQISNRIEQPATGLQELCGTIPDRNRLIAVLLCELHDLLREFAQHGFATLRTEWESYHVHQDTYVQLILPNGQISGVARGLTDEGALKLETECGIRIFHTGEVSLRSNE